MKKLYIFFILFMPTTFCIGQPIEGFFEVRLTEPGGEPGVMRVQMRAISSVVPATSDDCFDISFTIWWDNPAIIDIDVVQATSYGACLNEQAPGTGNSSGSGAPNGTIVKVGLATACAGGFSFPTNWVQGEWQNMANINICSVADCANGIPPPGITAADFLIQGFTGTSPNINVNFADYLPEGAPLPLNLLSFKASKNGERSSNLSWVTTNEENTSHFTVERSFDRKTWAKIGSVQAAGYSLGIETYSFDDIDVYNGYDKRVNVYYRLNMIDRDNRSKLSPTESVVFSGTGASHNEIAVYPNPASEGIHLEWNLSDLEQPTMLEFFDLHGKLIYSQIVAEEINQEYVDFTKTSIQPGLYLLRIMSGDLPVGFKQIVVDQR